MLVVFFLPCILTFAASPPRFRPILMQQPAVDAASAGGGAALLTASEVSLSYDGDRYLFQDISFNVARGAKLALVGENGAGKSSLLKVLCGREDADTGCIEVARNVRMTYVEQEPALPAGAKASEFIFSSDAPAVKALAEYRAAAAAAADGFDDEQTSERIGAAAARMDATDAWGIEAEMVRLCERLEVDHLLGREATSLSGGERKRVALAAALLSQPDVLLLDEPTNHLDIGAIRFLEDEVIGARSLTALIVTHDRSFLSATCSEVVEARRQDRTEPPASRACLLPAVWYSSLS